MTQLDDEELRAALIALTKDLVLFPSTLSRPKERARCMAFLRNHVESVPDIEVRQYESGGFESIVATPSGVEHPEILFCAHLDVVEHENDSAYLPRLEGDRLIGAGAGDMKGPLAICLQAFTWIHSNHPGASVGLAITSDEEIGGEHGIGFLFDEIGIRCGLAIILDGGAPNQATAEEKGILHLECRAENTGESSHASRPWLAENPLERLVSSLEKVRQRFEVFSASANDRWYPTCALTVIEVPTQSVNCIPDRAIAVVDIRFPPPFTAKQLMETVREVVDPTIELHRRISAEPTHLSPDPLFLEISRELSGQEMIQVRESGGSDARFVCPYGIPVIMTRPRCGNLHAEDEWIDVHSMFDTYQLVERFLTKKLRPSG